MFGIVFSYLSQSSRFLDLIPVPVKLNIKAYPAGLYGEEFEEDFAVSALGNSLNLPDAIGDDARAELVQPPDHNVMIQVMITLEQPEEALIARPIPT